ncbi:DUF6090 family protein [Winogradskyella sp.]|uniref:DUF6090 family protein n=1 Tax=Winogradskyella sp. TaxID=1883156 RepID=UPI003BA9C530
MGRYFKYAIGEILLVVIGILIALQINNWNEKRKDNEKLQSILLKIKEDLTGDLYIVNDNLFYLKLKDSIAQLIFNKEIDKETFSKIGGSYLPFTSRVLDMNMSGYNQLQSNLDKIPSNFKSLMSSLNEIYINTKSNLDIYNRLMDDAIDEHYKTLSETKPWFSDWSRNIPSKEADLYFLNDSLGHNRISIYLQNLDATAYEGFNLKLRSIKAIKIIDSLTIGNSELPEIATINLSNATIRKGLIGSYTLKENKDNAQDFTATKFNVIEEEGTLFLSSDIDFKSKMYWNHNLTFISQKGFVSFVKTEDGQIELQIQRRSGKLTFLKR